VKICRWLSKNKTEKQTNRQTGKRQWNQHHRRFLILRKLFCYAAMNSFSSAAFIKDTVVSLNRSRCCLILLWHKPMALWTMVTGYIWSAAWAAYEALHNRLRRMRLIHWGDMHLYYCRRNVVCRHITVRSPRLVSFFGHFDKSINEII